MPVARHSCPDEVFGRALFLWICLVSPLLCLLACIVCPLISGKQTFCSVCFHHGNPYWHELLYRFEAPGQGCATLWPASSLRIGVSASWTVHSCGFALGDVLIKFILTCSDGLPCSHLFNNECNDLGLYLLHIMSDCYALYHVHIITTFNPYHCTIYHFTQTQPHNKLNTSGTFLQQHKTAPHDEYSLLQGHDPFDAHQLHLCLEHLGENLGMLPWPMGRGRFRVDHLYALVISSSCFLKKCTSWI